MISPATPGAPSNRGKKLPPEVLTPDEVRALMDACSKRSPSGARNRALVATMYRSLARVSEVLALRPKDLNRDAGTLTILHGKGDRRRVVAMDEGAWAVLEVWLERRQAIGLNGRHPVFCTLKGRPLLTNYVRLLLPRLAKKAGIEKRVHAHALRHTGAAEMRAEGVDVAIISRQLGHSSISTTNTYLNHIAPQTVIAAVRKREWNV